jgi:hypothetical protein
LRRRRKPDLDIAGAELDLVVEVPELAPVPNFDGAEVAVCVLADPHTLRIVSIGPVRRRAAGADPFVAALMATLLLLEALPQGREQLLEAAHGLDQLLVLVTEIFLDQSLEPFRRNFGSRSLLHNFETAKHVAENAIELVEIALVLHQRGARQIVEALDLARGQILRHRLHQGEIFAQRHRDAGRSQFLEEGDEHFVAPAASPKFPCRVPTVVIARRRRATQ